MPFLTVRSCLFASAILLLGTRQALPQTAAATSRSKTTAAAPGDDWPPYGGNAEGARYSPLKQINRSSAAQLQVAWTYDAPTGGGRGGLQTQPIVVHGVVYANTPMGHVIALDGASGKLVWSWDSKNTTQKVRGMTYWAD